MIETAIMDAQAIQRAIARISYEIIEHNKGTENLCVVGILTRGVELAKRIAKKIQEVEDRPVAVGQLDITTFRDDKKGSDSACDSSQLDFSIENQSVVLVDDVIYTGRSVRAAIDALMARGRPRKIELAVLVDRGHRELPIRPDYVGKNVPTSRYEKIRVSVTPYDGVDRVTIVKEGD